MANDIGTRIATLRHRRKWTQARLAEEAGLSLGVVAKVEQGGGARLESLQAIAKALGVVAVAFVEPSDGDESDLDLLACIGRSSVGLDTLDAWEKLIQRYASTYGVKAPQLLLPHVEDLLTELKGLLRRPQPVKVRRKAVQLLGSLCAMAGNLCHDVDETVGARRYFEAGHLAAAEAEDDDLAALVLATHGLCAYFEKQVREASLLTARAIELTSHGSSPRRRAWVLALHARHLADTGEAEAALRMLELAAEALGAAGGVRGPADFFDENRLLAISGNVLQLANRGEEARVSLARALAERHPAEAKGRALVAADLAMCLVRQGEPEAAVQTMAEALDSARDCMVAPIKRRVRDLRVALRPWAGERFLVEFDETYSTVSRDSAVSLT